MRFRQFPGVAEVAPIGGFVKQYQVHIDPNKLVAYNISIDTRHQCRPGRKQ